ncbi:hypothetical protein Tco_1435440 [Tanacetum coccineum]
MIKSMVTESLEHAVLAKESSQPKSTYEVVASLIDFELKKILIDKIDESQSYLTDIEHRECYDGLIKSYDLDKSLFLTYDKVYSLKRSRKDKDQDEDPSARSDQGLKKRKTSKDVMRYLAFGRHLEETTDLHQHLSRLCSQRLETASRDTRDAVTIHPTMVSQEFTTASARTTQSKI